MNNSKQKITTFLMFQDGNAEEAMSLYVTCRTEEEINKIFEKLSEGGKILMPLESYPFSERFGWVNDKYGVSWQLTLEKE